MFTKTHLALSKLAQVCANAKTMAKLGLAALSCSVLLSSSADAATYRVGTTSNVVPFAFHDNNKKVTGFDIDLIRAIAKANGDKVIFEVMPQDALVPSLLTGRIDLALSGLIVDSHKVKRVDFSRVYYDSHLTLLMKSALQQSYQENPNLNELSLCVHDGSQGHELVKALGIKDLKLFQNDGEMLVALYEDKCQALVNDRPINLYYLNQAKLDDIVEVLDPQLSKTSENIAIAVRKGSPALLRRINVGLRVLAAEGELDALNQKWFGEGQLSTKIHDIPSLTELQEQSLAVYISELKAEAEAKKEAQAKKEVEAQIKAQAATQDSDAAQQAAIQAAAQEAALEAAVEQKQETSVKEQLATTDSKDKDSEAIGDSKESTVAQAPENPAAASKQDPKDAQDNAPNAPTEQAPSAHDSEQETAPAPKTDDSLPSNSSPEPAKQVDDTTDNQDSAPESKQTAPSSETTAQTQEPSTSEQAPAQEQANPQEQIKSQEQASNTESNASSVGASADKVENNQANAATQDANTQDADNKAKGSDNAQDEQAQQAKQISESEASNRESSDGQKADAKSADNKTSEVKEAATNEQDSQVEKEDTKAQ